MTVRRGILLAIVLVLVGLVVWEGGPLRQGVFYARNAECFERPRDGGVAAVGDSITAGTSKASVGLLGVSWFNSLACSESIEYGYNAARPETVTEVVGDTLLDDALDHDPSVVVILTGTNDVLKDRSLENAVAEIGRMTDRIRGDGAVPVVGTLPPFELAPDNTAAFNELLVDAAVEWGVEVIDFHEVTSDGRDWLPELTDDGIHPNERGSEVMAELAGPVLIEAQEAATRPGR